MAETLAQDARAAGQTESDLAAAFVAPQHGVSDVIEQSHGCNPFIRGGDHAAMKDFSTLQGLTSARSECDAPALRSAETGLISSLCNAT
jgi:hypothetical protein